MIVVVIRHHVNVMFTNIFKVMNKQTIVNLKQKIDSIIEYLESDTCKVCEKMRLELLECEKILNEYSRQNMDNTESNS